MANDIYTNISIQKQVQKCTEENFSVSSRNQYATIFLEKLFSRNIWKLKCLSLLRNLKTAFESLNVLKKYNSLDKVMKETH